MRAQNAELNLAAFIVELRRRAIGRTVTLSNEELRDPLSTLIRRVQSAPDTGESKAALLILRALARSGHSQGLPTSTLSSLSAESLILMSEISGLMMEGTYTADTIGAAVEGLS